MSDSDANSQVDGAASDGLSIATSNATTATSFADSISSDIPSVAQSLVSNAEALGTDLATIPAVSAAIAEAQSLERFSIASTAVDTVASSLYVEAADVYISTQTIVLSIANEYESQTSAAQMSTPQISTPQISTAQVSTTQNGGSNVINQTTSKATTSSSAAGAVMPTSGLGISLAGLAGIFGVIAIAL
jgi:hypothetical protein